MTDQHSCFICDKVAGAYRPHIGETVWHIGPVDGESHIACETHKDSLEDAMPLDLPELNKCYGLMICGLNEYSTCSVHEKCGSAFTAKHPEF